MPRPLHEPSAYLSTGTAIITSYVSTGTAVTTNCVSTGTAVNTSISNTRTLKLSNNTGAVQGTTVSTVPSSSWGVNALIHAHGTPTCFQIALATTLDVRINGHSRPLSINCWLALSRACTPCVLQIRAQKVFIEPQRYHDYLARKPRTQHSQ